MKTMTTSERGSNPIMAMVVFMLVFTAYSGWTQNVKMLLTESWSNNTWGNYARTVNSFTNGQLQSALSQTWNGHSWENNLREEHSYDRKGNVTASLAQLWNPYANGWEDAQRKTFVYDVSDRLLKETAETYVAGKWEYALQSENEYDADGYRTKTTVQKWDAIVADWTNISQSVYGYNGNGTVSRETIQTWNPSDKAWNNAERKVSQYNTSGKELNSTTQVWESGNWVNRSQEVNAYGNDGQMTTAQTQVWLPFANAWETDSFYSYDHNSDGTISQSLTQSKAGNNLNNELRFTFVYDSPAASSLALWQH